MRLMIVGCEHWRGVYIEAELVMQGPDHPEPMEVLRHLRLAAEVTGDQTVQMYRRPLSPEWWQQVEGRRLPPDARDLPDEAYLGPAFPEAFLPGRR